jgi:hypothetical protein
MSKTYYWSTPDVSPRFKLVSRSEEKSWTDGLCWYLWVISWLRSHGVMFTIVFTIDNGEEFGGKSWMKVRELRKFVGGFGTIFLPEVPPTGYCPYNRVWHSNNT